MTYLCRISDSMGKITHRTAETGSCRDLQVYWESKGFFLIASEPVQEKRTPGGNRKSVLEMTRTLTLMMQSGLTLKEAFETGSTLFNRTGTSLIYEGIHEDLRRGISFSDAITIRNHLFPALYRGMIHVGEKLGRLDRILPVLTDWLEKDKALRDRIGGALLYPALVMCLVISGLSGLLLFFLPYMEEILLSSGEGARENLNQAFTWARGLIIFFAALVLIPLLIRPIIPLIKRSFPFQALLLDKIKLKIPLLKKLLKTRDLLSLSFALALLTGCGVPLEEALGQTAEVVGNRYLKVSLLKIGDRLLKGFSLSLLFNEEGCFPKELGNWIALGERTGRIDRVFEQLRDYYQSEMDIILNRILTLAEPVIILFLGILLGVVIFKVFLPLITLYGGMS